MTSPPPDTPPPGDTGGHARKTFARPAAVTAAAMLGLVWGGLTIVSSLISMVGGSLLKSAGRACAPNDQSGLCAFAADSSGLLIVIGSALIGAAVLVIWGSTAARNGTNAKILVTANMVQIAIQITWMINTGSIAFGIIGIIVPTGTIGLIMSPASRTWFQRNGIARF